LADQRPRSRDISFIDMARRLSELLEALVFLARCAETGQRSPESGV
jgi:hypothetical protein